jgi:hypothetical protein
MAQARIPLAQFPGRAAAGSAIDKGAIEGALRGSSLMVCNCAIRCTFFLRPAPRHPRRGGPRVEGDIPSRSPRPPLGPTFGTDTVCVFDQPAQLHNDAAGDFAYRLPASSRSAIAHATNIGESDVWEIIGKR